MANYRVEDFTTIAPESDIVAVVYYEALDGYVEMYKNGTVKLVSKGGTIYTKFKEFQNRDWIRQSYIQTLVDSGVTGQELEKALEAIAQVESNFQSPQPLLIKGEQEGKTASLEERTEAHLRDWCAQKSLHYESLSEDEFAKIVAEGLNQVRKKG
ncbi:hypothetical protein FJZ31_11020 [Candidatus Poribacteria bacterium]|nr:hypothetical protein [Candidatus Poribacteria bacterium]